MSCAAERSPPRSEYLLLDAYPPITIAYTFSELHAIRGELQQAERTHTVRPRPPLDPAERDALEPDGVRGRGEHDEEKGRDGRGDHDPVPDWVVVDRVHVRPSAWPGLAPPRKICDFAGTPRAGPAPSCLIGLL